MSQLRRGTQDKQIERDSGRVTNGLSPEQYIHNIRQGEEALIVLLGWFELVADFADGVDEDRVVRVGFDFVS